MKGDPVGELRVHGCSLITGKCSQLSRETSACWSQVKEKGKVCIGWFGVGGCACQPNRMGLVPCRSSKIKTATVAAIGGTLGEVDVCKWIGGHWPTNGPQVYASYFAGIDLRVSV